MTPLRSFLFSCAGTLLLASASIAQDAAPAARIVSRIDEHALVRLPGNTHPAARAQNDRGPVSPDLSIDGLVLVLKRSPDQQAAFDAFVASQQDPKSDNYHHWLTPEEIGQRFGPVESDINAIENWMRSHGLNVGEVSQDHMTIRFGGTAAQIEAAFHTEIHNLDVKGVPHIANMSDPLIPAALTPVVVGPKALHNFQPRPLHRLGGKATFDRKRNRWTRMEPELGPDGKAAFGQPYPQFTVNDPTNGLLEDVTPYDFATIYNVLPLWTKGINGAGQTIAIAGTSQILASDLATFRSSFGLPPVPSFTQEVANGINPGECGLTPSTYCTVSDQIENSLDTEWSGAVAPGAKIVLVVSGENSAGTIDTVYDSAQYILEHKVGQILNVSYGLCELEEGTSGNQAYNNLWQTAAGAGVAVFVATGDSGSASCDEGGDQGGQNVPYAAEYGLSVSGIASPQYVTAVGGTDFAWCDPIKTNCTAGPYWSSSNNGTTKASAINYVPEIPWNSTCISKVGIEAAGYWDNQLYQTGYSGLPNTPQDGEQSCNFFFNWDQVIYSAGGPDLSFLVDTVGGSGGRSNCTTNNTTASSTTLDPSSCGSSGYPIPSWQSPLAGSAAAGHRSVPDVSFFASSGFLGSAYLICESPGNAACAGSYLSSSEDVAQEVGGTSASSPAMAGVMALINQKAGAPQGNPNVQLYKLAGEQNYGGCSSETVKTSSNCYFNDIDEQSNVQVCDAGGIAAKSPNCQVIHSGDGLGSLEGYSAGRGYDLATGLGSLNVANVVNAWPIADVPVTSFSASSITFASTEKGSASAAQTLTLQNAGHATLTLGNLGEGIKISGTNASSFSQTNSCGASLAAGASCTIKVVFTPTTTGALTATLTVADNATGSPQTVGLSGIGTAPAAAFSPTKVALSETEVGHTSYKKTVTFKNTGNATLTFSSITIDGTNAAAFSQTNTCGSALAAGASCVATVVFEPTNVIGALTGYLRFSDNAPGSPHKVLLTGTAYGAVVAQSRYNLVFPATTVGTASGAQSFIIKNKGNYKLAKPGGGSFVTLTGTNASSFLLGGTCAASGVAPGASCTVTVTFKPKSTGALKAQVTLVDNAYPTPQVVSLAGTGQ